MVFPLYSVFSQSHLCLLHHRQTPWLPRHRKLHPRLRLRLRLLAPQLLDVPSRASRRIEISIGARSVPRSCLSKGRLSSVLEMWGALERRPSKWEPCRVDKETRKFDHSKGALQMARCMEVIGAYGYQKEDLNLISPVMVFLVRNSAVRTLFKTLSSHGMREGWTYVFLILDLALHLASTSSKDECQGKELGTRCGKAVHMLIHHRFIG